MVVLTCIVLQSMISGITVISISRIYNSSSALSTLFAALLSCIIELKDLVQLVPCVKWISQAEDKDSETYSQPVALLRDQWNLAELAL